MSFFFRTSLSIVLRMSALSSSPSACMPPTPSMTCSDVGSAVSSRLLDRGVLGDVQRRLPGLDLDDEVVSGLGGRTVAARLHSESGVVRSQLVVACLNRHARDCMRHVARSARSDPRAGVRRRARADGDPSSGESAGRRRWLEKRLGVRARLVGRSRERATWHTARAARRPASPAATVSSTLAARDARGRRRLPPRFDPTQGDHHMPTLNESFSVPNGHASWAVINDLNKLIPCVPGAKVIGDREPDEGHGRDHGQDGLDGHGVHRPGRDRLDERHRPRRSRPTRGRRAARATPPATSRSRCRATRSASTPTPTSPARPPRWARARSSPSSRSSSSPSRATSPRRS